MDNKSHSFRDSHHHIPSTHHQEIGTSPIYFLFQISLCLSDTKQIVYIPRYIKNSYGLCQLRRSKLLIWKLNAMRIRFELWSVLYLFWLIIYRHKMVDESNEWAWTPQNSLKPFQIRKSILLLKLWTHIWWWAGRTCVTLCENWLVREKHIDCKKLLK